MVVKQARGIVIALLKHRSKIPSMDAFAKRHEIGLLASASAAKHVPPEYQTTQATILAARARQEEDTAPSVSLEEMILDVADLSWMDCDDQRKADRLRPHLPSLSAQIQGTAAGLKLEMKMEARASIALPKCREVWTSLVGMLSRVFLIGDGTLESRIGAFAAKHGWQSGGTNRVANALNKFSEESSQVWQQRLPGEQVAQVCGLGGCDQRGTKKCSRCKV